MHPVGDTGPATNCSREQRDSEERFAMAKGRDKRKVNDRTKATKTLKEKRKAKKDKPK
jgi:hypothetical protein